MIQYVPFSNQLVDILTNHLRSSWFIELEGKYLLLIQQDSNQLEIG